MQRNTNRPHIEKRIENNANNKPYSAINPLTIKECHYLFGFKFSFSQRCMLATLPKACRDWFEQKIVYNDWNPTNVCIIFFFIKTLSFYNSLSLPPSSINSNHWWWLWEMGKRWFVHKNPKSQIPSRSGNGSGNRWMMMVRSNWVIVSLDDGGSWSKLID